MHAYDLTANQRETIVKRTLTLVIEFIESYHFWQEIDAARTMHVRVDLMTAVKQNIAPSLSHPTNSHISHQRVTTHCSTSADVNVRQLDVNLQHETDPTLDSPNLATGESVSKWRQRMNMNVLLWLQNVSMRKAWFHIVWLLRYGGERSSI